MTVRTHGDMYYAVTDLIDIYNMHNMYIIFKVGCVGVLRPGTVLGLDKISPVPRVRVNVNPM